MPRQRMNPQKISAGKKSVLLARAFSSVLSCRKYCLFVYIPCSFLTFSYTKMFENKRDKFCQAVLSEAG